MSRPNLGGMPEELANRMMMRRGSERLLRSLQGRPEPVAPRLELVKPKPKRKRNYTPVSERPGVAIPVSVRKIINSVCTAFELTPDDLFGRGRSMVCVVARSVTVRLIRDRKWSNGLPRHSFPRIAAFMKRDHSTVLHANRQFDVYCEQFPEAREIYERITREAEMGG